MSTHIVCFCREIRNRLCGFSLLSVAMNKVPSTKASVVNVRRIIESKRKSFRYGSGGS